MSSKIAIVTGANKGIGLAVIRQLAKVFDGTIYLTSRDENRGLESFNALKKQGFSKVAYHQLDITDSTSCKAFIRYIKEKHGHIDILINNAAIAFTMNSNEPFGQQAEITMATNFFGTQHFSNMAFPLLAKNARVVNVSSLLGHLSCLNNGKEPEASVIKAKLADPTISIDVLNGLAKSFVDLAKENRHIAAGWINSAYSTSKIFVSVLTRIQQREIDRIRPDDNIIINAVHPGYVDTDMSGHKGVFTPERGAQPLVWCAMISEDSNEPRGGFIWHDNRVLDFTASSYPKD